MNLLIKFPNNFNNPARRKNLIPLPKNATKINKKKFKPKKPLAIVMNLKGKGVKPAPKTIQKPKLL